MKTDDASKFHALRDRLVNLEAMCRGALHELDQILGPAPVNAEFLAEKDRRLTDGLIKEAVQSTPPLAIKTPAKPAVQLPLVPSKPQPPFDMETSVKASGKWECDTLRCRECTLDQNTDCLTTYQIKVPFTNLTAKNLHAEEKVAASTRTPLPDGVKEYSPSATYKKGDTIQHRVFGQGKVLNVTVAERSSNMDVEFSAGKKNLGFARKK